MMYKSHWVQENEEINQNFLRDPEFQLKLGDTAGFCLLGFQPNIPCIKIIKEKPS